MGNSKRKTMAAKLSVLLGLWLLVSTVSLVAAQAPETMTPAQFQKIVSTPGDTVPLVPELASAPFWTNAVATNVMTYASGRVVRETLRITARTVGGKYIVYSFQSEFYHRMVHSMETYDGKTAALKSYGLYSDEHGRDVLTEGTIAYNFPHRTYTMTGSYGEFRETTTGSYTDSEDTAKTLIYQNGELFMTREVKTHRL